MIRIYQEKDYEAMSRRAAGIIAAEVIRKPDCVLGLATGSSPVGTYKELIAKNQRGELSFEEVCTVNLDEYKGLAPDHDQSYRYFMQTNLFDHIDIDKENTFVPDGLAEDAEDECARYDALVYALGGTDLQLLHNVCRPWIAEHFYTQIGICGVNGYVDGGKPHFHNAVQLFAADVGQRYVISH